MKRIKIYWWFWGTIPIFLFLGFIYTDSQLDLPNESWLKVFPLNNHGIPVSIFLFISGLGYLLISKKRNLNMLHFIATTVGLLLLAFPKIIFLANSPRRYYSNTNEPTFFDFILEMNYLSLFATSLIILGIITYFINLGIVIFKKAN